MLAVYAAESLLLAFSLKLRVSAALAGHRGPRPAAPAAAAALGLDDASFHRAASFLGQCMPTYGAAPGMGRPALKVSRRAASRGPQPAARRLRAGAQGPGGGTHASREYAAASFLVPRF